ncbi:MAG: DMT family transporter [FCB group bacterium]|nr:DMT family transporter [FCB group bacterium]
MTEIPYIGEILSLASAMIWGLSVVFFKKIGERVSPIALNPFKNMVGMILFLVTILLLHQPILQPIAAAGSPGLTLTDYALLILSGIVGIGIADTIFFMSLNTLGAGISAIVDSAYSPMVILFAYVLVGERLGLLQFLGAGLIIAAILITTYKVRKIPVSQHEYRKGVVLAITAVGLMALGVVIIKPVLNKVYDDASMQLWIAGFRLVPGVLVSGLIFLFFNRRSNLTAPFKDKSLWPLLLGSSFMGSFIALTMWIGGMAMTKASVASVLNQTSTVWIFIFAWLFLKEPITRRRSFSLISAVIGVYLVFIGGI